MILPIIGTSREVPRILYTDRHRTMKFKCLSEGWVGESLDRWERWWSLG